MPTSVMIANSLTTAVDADALHRVMTLNEHAFRSDEQVDRYKKEAKERKEREKEEEEADGTTNFVNKPSHQVTSGGEDPKGEVRDQTVEAAPT